MALGVGLLTSLSVFGIGNSAQALILTYTIQTDFLNAIQLGYYQENFESISITGTPPSPINYTNGTYSYQASVSGLGSNEFYGAGSSGDKWLSANNANDSINFTNFSPTIKAIGGFFFPSDVSGALTTGIINVSVNGGSSSLSTVTGSATNFFGFISNDATPITSLVVNTSFTGTSIWPTVNNLIVGQPIVAEPVPEPVTILGTLLAGGLGVAFKKKQKSL
ncbi:PEP-CTERM sorting domain-containing protein [Geminocystis sp. GBBB08]|uniref:PEP-CTERM sorting domain-containing protein n=1 Tax=Geminocystis sp. GBBB08 TaxID=2604140 RepID=UPI0027E3648D|nr:PEP-CTERM sorting domain-containing protein [Geminocystis sp. GBBB08]MBL1208517.1 PEP-CTERM sorting domain-containing protein [Geminocystis sp. GBBB08]